MAASDPVWVNPYKKGAGNTKSLYPEFADYDPDIDPSPFRVAASRAVKFDLTRLEHMPTFLHLGGLLRGQREDPNLNLDKMPDFFTIAGGGIAVSHALADVLQRHNMGRNQLKSLDVYEGPDRTVPTGHSFVFVDVCELKSAFLPELSAGFVKVRNTDFYNVIEANAVVALKHLDDNGIDLWRDKVLGGDGLFLSDRLKRALDVAGFKLGRFATKKCKVHFEN